MKIRSHSGTFIIPKDKEGYVLFIYDGDGAFDIRVEDGQVEVYIPQRVRSLDEYRYWILR